MGKKQENTSHNNKKRAIDLFNEGSEAWKKGNRAKAMTLYAESAELDEEGPGAHALEMTKNIMDFYDKNQFNP